MSTPYRLITIPPSHYCEKARWALETVGADFREERHPPLLHLRSVRAAGGRRSTPVLRGRGVVVTDSTDILEHLQRAHGELPPAMLTLVEDFRATPAGEFALRMYRDHR